MSFGISSKTRKLLKQHNIVLKKSLGQNFLTDAHVLQQIIDAADLDEQAGVIEIGPGLGALTEGLAKSAKKVVAIELDNRLIPILQDLFQDQSNVEIVHADALKLDFAQLISDKFSSCSKVHVVANLPYYVTSPILVKLLESKLSLSNIVVMIQKEVAERILASPGSKTYGSLSVFAQYFSEPSKVVQVPAHVFVPRPQVDSMVIRLSMLPQSPVPVDDEAFFFQVVRASFAKRRKTLLNSLSSSLPFPIEKTQLEELIRSIGIDPSCRGEMLSIESFAQLSNVLLQVKNGVTTKQP
ncbi:16S rRNA (adenine(1518)-N(6)/adenine(1519)-N(6))-dimethyltransferase RsmA [Shimazuella kribbensis]|uniref:16S rRNA (adenine(1518)-N(6)/adenine(1519)-N(6))- dimethyltransferase RsmA n=1 Tax=Shimazuella kribbensis TaxID=139808 RepID=UPI00041DBE63|nr:16S rRNA (adenine(1518)-N(6)/adenine(1519)-N(6))-dimethyltransferase RsmA [Shimazuella kribbensis]